MGFESGNVNFRLFYLQHEFDSALVERFAAHAAPPIETLGYEPIHGWVGPAHLLDRDFSEEHCCFTSAIHLSYMTAEKKIPASTLSTFCKVEEELEMKAREIQFLPRALKMEVKQRVTDMLMKDALPVFTAIPIVVDLRNRLLLAAAMSDAQVDKLLPYFKETAGVMPVLLTPETAAMKRRQMNVNDMLPVLYTPDPHIEVPFEISLGTDFFTWLLYFWEKEGGTFSMDGSTCGMMIEGPLTFYHEGAGAHEAVLRKGTPLDGRELGIALYCAKKLRRAKVTFTRGEEIVSATMDATDFSFRGMKLPKSEQEDAVGRFQERMACIEMFWSCWLTLFDRFLDLRADAGSWSDTVEKMKQWVENRANPPDLYS